MLVEPDAVALGSAWHAAGLSSLFNAGFSTGHIHDYSLNFYKGLKAETGLNPGFAATGNHAQRPAGLLGIKIPAISVDRQAYDRQKALGAQFGAGQRLETAQLLCAAKL